MQFLSDSSNRYARGTALMTTFLVLVSAAGSSVVTTVEAAASPPYQPGKVLVGFKDGRAVTVHLRSGQSVSDWVSRFKANEAVAYAEPDYLVQASAFDPNDVYYPEQWYLRQIGAPLAWERTTGSPDVVVAVLDSGVDINHPDLKANIWRNPGEIDGDGLDNDGNGYIDDVHGWDFIEDTNDPRPDATPPYSRTALNHGTLVAGIIAAVGNNVEGTAGVAWRTRLMPLRVLDRNGQGDVDAVARAVDYAVRNGASIINLSFVGAGFSERLYQSLRRAYQKNVVIVAAAGNINESVGGTGDLDQNFLYPVCYDAAEVAEKTDWIIGVTATDNLDQRLPFANIGSRCVDMAAPGIAMFSTQVYDLPKGLSEAYGGGWSGTSLAAPIVSGVAALVRAAYPKLTNAQVINVLLKSADSISVINRGLGDRMGRGRVNASRALLGAASPGKAPPFEATAVGGRIVTVSLIGGRTELKLLSGSGDVKTSWQLPFGERFHDGVTVAVSENSRLGPRNGNRHFSATIRGEQRIVVGEGRGGEGRVLVYDPRGQVTSGWLAFNRVFRGGVSVASGDVYGTGEGSILVAPLSGGGPQVRIFDRGGRLKGQFFAYDKSVRGGLSVAAADLDGDGRAEIVVGAKTSGLPVRVFTASGRLLDEWPAFPNFHGGLNVATGDLDGNGLSEVIVSPADAGGPMVRLFEMSGRLRGQFFAFDQTFLGGVNVAVGDIDGDGRDEIVAAPARSGGPQVRIFSDRGKLLGQFFVYDRRLRLGVRVAVLR